MEDSQEPILFSVLILYSLWYFKSLVFFNEYVCCIIACCSFLLDRIDESINQDKPFASACWKEQNSLLKDSSNLDPFAAGPENWDSWWATWSPTSVSLWIFRVEEIIERSQLTHNFFANISMLQLVQASLGRIIVLYASPEAINWFQNAFPQGFRGCFLIKWSFLCSYQTILAYTSFTPSQQKWKFSSILSWYTSSLFHVLIIHLKYVTLQRAKNRGCTMYGNILWRF